VAGRARARELGVVPGALPPGPVNAITDVPGVRVGHVTLIEGTDIRTGVTAIVHDTLTGQTKLPAGLSVFNGFGKMVGSTQLDELGEIETPILLTSTLATFAVADALIGYLLALPGNEQLTSVNPIVAETNDGYLSDSRSRPITAAHVLHAIAAATAGPIAEGCVGAGTGTSSLGFKAGIGTASRMVHRDGMNATIGVLVQANFSGTLTVLGVPFPVSPSAAGPAAGNSCVIVISTDAPLDSRQLRRVARRSLTAMARTGSDFSGRSGDYALAFSTVPYGATAGWTCPVPENDLDLFFAAAIEATEEAILNSLFMAESMTGFKGHARQAVPLDDVRQRVGRYGEDRGGAGLGC